MGRSRSSSGLGAHRDRDRPRKGVREHGGRAARGEGLHRRQDGGARGVHVVHERQAPALNGVPARSGQDERTTDVSPALGRIQGGLGSNLPPALQARQQWDLQRFRQGCGDHLSLVVATAPNVAGRCGHRHHERGLPYRCNGPSGHLFAHEPADALPALVLEGVHQLPGRRLQKARRASSVEEVGPLDAVQARRRASGPQRCAAASANGMRDRRQPQAATSADGHRRCLVPGVSTATGTGRGEKEVDRSGQGLGKPARDRKRDRCRASPRRPHSCGQCLVCGRAADMTPAGGSSPNQQR